MRNEVYELQAHDFVSYDEYAWDDLSSFCDPECERDWETLLAVLGFHEGAIMNIGDAMTGVACHVFHQCAPRAPAPYLILVSLTEHGMAILGRNLPDVLHYVSHDIQPLIVVGRDSGGNYPEYEPEEDDDPDEGIPVRVPVVDPMGPAGFGGLSHALGIDPPRMDDDRDAAELLLMGNGLQEVQ